MKKLLSLLIVLLLCIPVAATEILDPNAIGSITFTMDYDGQPLDGGALEIYRVAVLRLDDQGPEFIPVEGLESIDPDWGDLTEDLALQLAELVSKLELEATAAPVEKGRAKFEDLLPGVYLVTQREENATEGYSSLQPFLVSLPQWREDRYVYHLTLEPKVALEPKPTEPTEPTEPTDPTDPTEPELPQTGQLNWPVPLLCVSGLGLFVLGFYLCFGKRNCHET